jgi:GT2 family glycosyltransferase
LGISPSSPSRVALSAIVPTHRQRDLLSACLESVEEALSAVPEPTELIVVDNDSRDGTADLLRKRFVSARILTLTENVGYAGAVVRALDASQGEWVALLNDDLTVEKNMFVELLRAARANDAIGSVAPQIRFAGKTGVLNSAGIVVDRLGVAFDRLVGEPVDMSETDDTDVFGASGAAGLFRRRMLDELGGIDQTFFMFLEDADLAWRARMAGWQAVYAPRAVARHHHSASAGHGSSMKHYLVGRNRVRLIAKNADRSQLLRHGPAMIGYDLCHVAFAAVSHRTLAPLRGRLRGLVEWREYRRAGASSRRPTLLDASAGIRGAVRRHRVWSKLPSAEH